MYERSSKASAPGQLQSIKVDIDKPKMSIDVPFSMLTMLVGMNGVGKSFILKLSWMLGFIGSSYNRFIKDFQTQLNVRDAVELAQYALDGTFSHPDFSGTIVGDYGSCSITLKLTDGKVTENAMIGFDNIQDFVPTVYMSSGMRTFSAISGYLRARKKIYKVDSPAEMYGELLKEFRLYDITYIEQMINKCPFTFSETVLKALREDFDFTDEFEVFDVDLDACDFFVLLREGKKKYMTTYGNGHQSILNMMVGNL